MNSLPAHVPANNRERNTDITIITIAHLYLFFLFFLFFFFLSITGLFSLLCVFLGSIL